MSFVYHERVERGAERERKKKYEGKEHSRLEHTMIYTVNIKYRMVRNREGSDSG